MQYYYDRLFDERILWLEGHITDLSANMICSQIMLLAAESDADIALYINSPGGSVTAGLAIYDTMQYIHCDVSTVCLGQAASMAAVLLSSGTPGKRCAFPNAEVMFHSVSAGFWGKSQDIEITADRIKEINTRLLEIIATNCDKDYETVERDLDRDFFLDAWSAKSYGAIDHVIR